MFMYWRNSMSYIKGKDKNQILDDLAGTAKPGSQIHEQQKAAIKVRCTEAIQDSLSSLEKQLEINAKSADKVGQKIFWLNVVLALATLVGAIATVVIAART